MRDITQPPHICSMDPLSLTSLAVGAAGGGLMSLLGGGSKEAPPTPTPPPVPPPQRQAEGDASKTKPQQPSFLGASAVPQQQNQSKSLLGQ